MSYFCGPMWNWFSLSHSSYLVIPRALLCGMPPDWQQRMADLLNEVGEVYDQSQIKDTYTVNLREGKKYIADPYRDYRHPCKLPYLGDLP